MYSKKEVEDILGRRVELGFHRNAITDETFQLVVNLTHDSKDLRLGLFLLKMSGIEAERWVKRKIEVEDVEKVYERGKSLFLDKSLSSLNSIERDVLKKIYSTNKITSRELYEIFKKRISYRIFYETLKNLRESDLLI